MVQALKSLVEQATGLWSPSPARLRNLVREGKTETYRFRDDGKTPNHPQFPVVIYRNAVVRPPDLDPAAIFERLFARNGWTGSWRNGVYTFNHFHTRTHEVLGIARGFVRIRFGGAKGRVIRLEAGDAVVQPAGTGHKRVGGSKDLLVVGAYPEGSAYDEPQASKESHDAAVARIARVGRPRTDPLLGRRGPLLTLWRSSRPR